MMPDYKWGGPLSIHYQNNNVHLKATCLSKEYARTYGTSEAIVTSTVLRPGPAGNCGMMEATGIYTLILTPELGAFYIGCLEVLARTMSRSVLIGNDGVDKNVWRSVKRDGTNWNMIVAGRNRNYDTTDKHHVGIFYKNVGDFEYPDIYGVGKVYGGLEAAARS